jgi:hypothetical protein
MIMCSICGGYGRLQGAIAPFSPVLQELPCPACDGLGIVASISPVENTLLRSLGLLDDDPPHVPVLKPHTGQRKKPLSARAKAKIGERHGSLKRNQIAREFLKP